LAELLVVVDIFTIWHS